MRSAITVLEMVAPDEYAPTIAETLSREIMRLVSVLASSTLVELPNTAAILAPFMLLMPPPLLISSMAISTAILINCPDSANDPVKGSRKPTFTSLVWARTGKAMVLPNAPNTPTALTNWRRDGWEGVDGMRGFLFEGALRDLGCSQVPVAWHPG